MPAGVLRFPNIRRWMEVSGQLSSREASVLQMIVRFPVSIYHITKKRMADRRHMHADLMGAPRLQTAFNITVFPKCFQDFVMCNGRFPIFSLTAIFLRSFSSRPIGAFIVPSSTASRPCTMARYFRVMECSFN